MKTVMIINEETDKLESTYQVKDEKVNEEVAELKKLYDDVGIDNQGDVVAWK